MPPRSFRVVQASWAEHHAALSQLRFTVFVREQGVPPEMELDAADADESRVLHSMALDANGNVIGTGRLILESPVPRIGRMAVLRAWRGQGVGKEILESLCALAKQRGFTQVRLHSQSHATPFYYKQGFLSHGREFAEAGIPHQEMRRDL